MHFYRIALFFIFFNDETLLIQKLEDIQNELKMKFNLEDTKARLMQTFKEEGDELKEQVLGCFQS